MMATCTSRAAPSWLPSASIKDYKGLSGTVTCDATGECSASGPTFYQDQSGKWVEAK